MHTHVMKLSDYLVKIVLHRRSAVSSVLLSLSIKWLRILRLALIDYRNFFDDLKNAVIRF